MIALRSKLILIGCCVLLIGCDTYVESTKSAAEQLREATQAAEEILTTTLTVCQQAILKGDLPQARLANVKAQRQVHDLFKRVYRYEDKLVQKSTKAAEQADEYAKGKPGWWDEYVNPFYDFSLSWRYAKRGFLKTLGWVGAGILLLIGLEFWASASPIITAVLRFIGMVVGHLIRLFTNLADGCFAVLERARVQDLTHRVD